MGMPARSFQAATTKGKALVKNDYLFLTVRNDKEQDTPMEQDFTAVCQGLAWKATSTGEKARLSFVLTTLHTVARHLYSLNCLKTGPGVEGKHSGEMPSSEPHHN